MTEHIGDLNLNFWKDNSSIRSVFLVRCDVSVQACSNNFHFEKYLTIAMLVDLRIHLYFFVTFRNYNSTFLRKVS